MEGRQRRDWDAFIDAIDAIDSRRVDDSTPLRSAMRLQRPVNGAVEAQIAARQAARDGEGGLVLLDVAGLNLGDDDLGDPRRNKRGDVIGARCVRLFSKPIPAFRIACASKAPLAFSTGDETKSHAARHDFAEVADDASPR